MRVAGIILIVAALIMPVAGCVGRPSKDLDIRTWYDLDAVRNNLAGHHRLMNSLNATTPGYDELAGPRANGGRGWLPIGDELARFTGSFDGQGYEITNLFVGGGGGLFGRVAGGGLLENVGVVDATVTGGSGVGGLVGYFVEGTVSNCHFTGCVTGNRNVGGLIGQVGWTRGITIKNSYYNYDAVLINGENTITIGAMFGEDFEEWLANDKSLDVGTRLSEEDGHYLIHDVGDFKQLLAFGQDDSLRFRLQDDLDLGAEPNLYIPYFAGEFDGNGHRIWNVSLDLAFVSHVGLFGYLAPGGEVTGLGVEQINVRGVRDVGGLVGFIWEGSVSNSHASGNITGNEYVGGLVGLSQGGTVSNSYASVSLSGVRDLGGLVGYNRRGIVSGSYASGRVHEEPTGVDSSVGGLVGVNFFGTVSSCYASSNVSGFGPIGGLVGSNSGGAIDNTYASGSVAGSLFVGGLVGGNSRGATVSNSYASGRVIGYSPVGGLVGSNHGNMTESHSHGRVTGFDHVRGLVRVNYGGTVSESYAGGLVGFNAGRVSNSFWDVETSGMEESDGGTGKTTAEMQNTATFTLWDIVAVAPGQTDPECTWNIVDGVTYPFLSWQLHIIYPDPIPEPPPYNPEVRTWHDLDAIRYHLGERFILMNDLDSSTAGYQELASETANGRRGWAPIGRMHPAAAFMGDFDGQGYEIRDLFVDRPLEVGVGLFSLVGWGTIENVGVVNANVTGDAYVGALVGQNLGTVRKCYAGGSITGWNVIGGLVGENPGNVSKSYSTGTASAHSVVGGLVGANPGNVSDSYAGGNVRGEQYVGGLVGENRLGDISNSYSDANVTGGERFGGLVGFNDRGAVTDSFWDVETSGMGESDGGTGKTTAEMMDIATFTDMATEGLDQPWDMIVVAPGESDAAHIWNIVYGETYPFLSWQVDYPGVASVAEREEMLRERVEVVDVPLDL